MELCNKYNLVASPRARKIVIDAATEKVGILVQRRGERIVFSTWREEGYVWTLGESTTVLGDE